MYPFLHYLLHMLSFCITPLQHAFSLFAPHHTPSSGTLTCVYVVMKCSVSKQHQVSDVVTVCLGDLRSIPWAWAGRMGGDGEWSLDFWDRSFCGVVLAGMSCSHASLPVSRLSLSFSFKHDMSLNFLCPISVTAFYVTVLHCTFSSLFLSCSSLFLIFFFTSFCLSLFLSFPIVIWEKDRTFLIFRLETVSLSLSLMSFFFSFSFLYSAFYSYSFYSFSLSNSVSLLCTHILMNTPSPAFLPPPPSEKHLYLSIW